MDKAYGIPGPTAEEQNPRPLRRFYFYLFFWGGAVRAGNFRAFALFVLVFFFFCGFGFFGAIADPVGVGDSTFVVYTLLFLQGGSSHAWLEAERA